MKARTRIRGERTVAFEPGVGSESGIGAKVPARAPLDIPAPQTEADRAPSVGWPGFERAETSWLNDDTASPLPRTVETIAGADWYGDELDRRRFQSTLFTDLDLSEARNTGCVFNECTFRRARFNGSTHHSAAFVNCTFAACNFFDTTFTECKFVGSMFDSCQFDSMQVVDGDWSFVGLPGSGPAESAFPRHPHCGKPDLTGRTLPGWFDPEMSISPEPGCTAPISRIVTCEEAT
jgi:hypothetical protein